MHILSMLGRLLWKEWRQGWAVLLLGLLAIIISGILKDVKIFRIEMPHITLSLLLLVAAVRGAMLAAGERYRRAYDGIHFSVHPALGPTLTFWFHLAIIILLGAAFGGVMQSSGEYISPWWRVGFGVVYLGGAFGLSFVVSTAFSPPAGIVAALFWVVGNAKCFVAFNRFVGVMKG